jgi:hypothetical protein
MFGSRPRPAAAALALFLSGVLAAALAPQAFGLVVFEEAQLSGITNTSSGTSTHSSSSSGKSSSLRIARPVGVLPGDLMLAGLTARLSSSAQITPPSGWRQVRRDSNIGGATLTQALYYKTADSSDFGPFTWRFSSSTGVAGGIIAFSGLEQSAPVRASSGLYQSNSRLIAAPGLTTTLDDTPVVGFFGGSSRMTIAPPNGMSEEYDLMNGSGGKFSVSSESSWLLQSRAGPTGFKVATGSAAASSSIGQLVVLAPASVPLRLRLLLRLLRRRLRRRRLRRHPRPGRSVQCAASIPRLPGIRTLRRVLSIGQCLPAHSWPRTAPRL